MQLNFDNTPVGLAPIRTYSRRQLLLRRTKMPQPTAEMVIDGALSEADAEALADDACLALSIVQGHKVNWIARTTLDADGSPSIRLWNRVTKNISPIPMHHDDGKDGWLPIHAAEDCYAAVLALRQKFGLSGDFIEIWLEGRTDSDYIQTRAIKQAITIEALLARVLETQESTAQVRLNEQQWSDFLGYIIPAARSYLKTIPGIKDDQIQPFSNSDVWAALNRKAFRSSMNAAFKALGVQIPGQDIGHFVKSRNKLIHEGRFRCESEPHAVQQDTTAPQTVLDEYLFVARFVDRVVLHAFGLAQRLKASPAQ